jgi:hypothetical protein
MSEVFGNIADEFFVNINLQTTIALPKERETVLSFCQTIQKQFPSMTSLYQREGSEYVLEGDREAGRYQWLELQTNSLSAGSYSPTDLHAAYAYLRWVLERCVYFLGIGGIDVECLDVTFGFNLDFIGNRDAIVGEALMYGTPMMALASEGMGPCIECEPSTVVALDGDCAMQARLAVETRCNSYQVRTGNFSDEPISVYYTIRRHPRPGEVLDLPKAFDDIRSVGEDTASRIVVPQVVRPIVAAIATG